MDNEMYWTLNAFSVCSMDNLLQETVLIRCIIMPGGETGDPYELYYCFRAISTIRCKARPLDLMKMIERDRFAFRANARRSHDRKPARIRRMNNANDGSTRGILGILIGKFPIYFGSTRAECGDISIAHY